MNVLNDPTLLGGIIIGISILLGIIVHLIFSGMKNTKEVHSDISHIEDALNNETYRKCPIDGINMKKEIMGNAVVDVCKKCGGIFLDKDELEKVIIKDV